MSVRELLAEIVWLLAMRLTGGRPMIKGRYLFTDRYDGPVHLFIDRLGRDWMATSRWAIFRMRYSP